MRNSKQSWNLSLKIWTEFGRTEKRDKHIRDRSVGPTDYLACMPIFGIIWPFDETHFKLLKVTRNILFSRPFRREMPTYFKTHGSNFEENSCIQCTWKSVLLKMLFKGSWRERYIDSLLAIWKDVYQSISSSGCGNVLNQCYFLYDFSVLTLEFMIVGFVLE